MVQKFFMLSLMLFLSGFSHADVNHRLVLTCSSIDPTYTPYVNVDVYQFDVTFEGYYLVRVTMLDGQSEDVFYREGSGDVNWRDFHVTFRGKNDEKLEGSLLQNHLRVAQLSLDGKHYELVCSFFSTWVSI